MRKLLLSVLVFPAFLQAQQNDSAKLSIPQLLKEKVKSILPPKTQQLPPPVVVKNNTDYRTLPWLHGFLDTASDMSINRFLAETDDSTLQLVHYESISARHAYFIDNPSSSPGDRDGDGQNSFAAGGTDCDDLNNYSYRGNVERCEGYFIFEGWKKKYILIYRYQDEDCNPCTVSAGHLRDGDKDRDGQVSCACINYIERIPAGCDEVSIVPTNSSFSLGNPARQYTVRGWDCDDHNPAIIRASQICIDKRTVAICENGKWRYYLCLKCVAQPNGTGVVLE